MHPDLRKLAQTALMQCDQESAKAKTWLIRHLLDDRDLFEAHILPIIETTVDQILRELNGAERIAIRNGREWVGPYKHEETPEGSWTGSRPKPREVPPSQRLMKGQRLMAERNYLNYPIGHQVLGDLTKDDLYKSATWYLQAAQTNKTTGTFLMKIADQLPDFTTRVRELWTAVDLAKLHDTVEAEELTALEVSA